MGLLYIMKTVTSTVASSILVPGITAGLQGPSTGFDPLTEIPNLVVYYDDLDTSKLTLVDTDKVTDWAPTVGSGDLSQADSNRYPQSTADGVDFIWDDSILTANMDVVQRASSGIATGYPWQCAVAIRSNNLSATSVILGFHDESANNRRQRLLLTSNAAVRANATSNASAADDTETANGAVTVNTWHILQAEWNSSTDRRVRVDNGSWTTTSVQSAGWNSNIDVFAVGCNRFTNNWSNPFRGEIGDVFIFNRPTGSGDSGGGNGLSDTEWDNLYTWMAARRS